MFSCSYVQLTAQTRKRKRHCAVGAAAPRRSLRSRASPRRKHCQRRPHEKTRHSKAEDAGHPHCADATYLPPLRSRSQASTASLPCAAPTPPQRHPLPEALPPFAPASACAPITLHTWIECSQCSEAYMGGAACITGTILSLGGGARAQGTNALAHDTLHLGTSSTPPCTTALHVNVI
jgi:hypothetical protein